MGAFALLVQDVVIQDQHGAMLGTGVHNKEVLDLTWKYGEVSNRTLFPANSRADYSINYYDDTKYADIDVIGMPDITVLIDPSDPDQYQRLLNDRAELNQYVTETNDEDRTPRNMTTANINDVEITVMRAHSVRAFAPIARLGETPCCF